MAVSCSRRLVLTRVSGAAQRQAKRNGALQTRDRFSLWRSRISDAPLHFVTRCTASGTRQRRTRSESYSLFKQPISFPRRVFAPGVCDFASLTPNEGWAERRSAQCHAPTCSSMQRTSRKTPAEPAHYQKTEHYRAATRIDKNRTKCRLTCGSDRMLVVRSGSRAEVEKKGVRLSGGHKGSWGLSPFGLHFKLLRDPMVNPKVDHKGRS